MPRRPSRQRLSRAQRSRALMRRQGRFPGRNPGNFITRRNLSAYPGRPFPGLPKSKRVVMRYVDNIQLDAPAGGVAVHQFRANSINAPDVAGGGSSHRPLGFDQWLQFYNHYIIDKSTITVVFTATSANQDGAVFGTYLSDDLTIPLNAIDILEQGLATWKIAALGTNSISEMTVRNSFNAKKMFNIKDIKDNIVRLGAVMTANPTEGAFYSVFTQSLNLLNNPDPLFLLVTIEYSVIFSEPRSLPQS